MNKNLPAAQIFPVKHSLSGVVACSVITALLMAAASIAGVLFSSTLYPSDSLRQTFLTNDVINLVLGLPILIGSIWLTLRGSLFGLLLWPGALLYVFYNYIAYTFVITNPLLAVIYLSISVISIVGFILILRVIDLDIIRSKLTNKAPVRASAWTMIVFGAFFILRVAGLVFDSITDHTPLPANEIGVSIADFILSLLWISGGILLLRHKPLGYTAGLGLLFAAVMLFIGLLAYFIMQPFLTDLPFPLTDFVVVAVMGMICFVPFGLFARSVRLAEIS